MLMCILDTLAQGCGISIFVAGRIKPQMSGCGLQRYPISNPIRAYRKEDESYFNIELHPVSNLNNTSYNMVLWSLLGVGRRSIFRLGVARILGLGSFKLIYSQIKAPDTTAPTCLYRLLLSIVVYIASTVGRPVD